ncbi:MAG: tetratricopeptide repeat protein [Chloroflexota bacterium]|nr:MAG: hypothetical protein DIU68_10015 [Chloroflexota bacterium]
MRHVLRWLLLPLLLIGALFSATAQDIDQVIYFVAPAAPTNAAAQNFLTRLAAEFQALDVSIFVVDELPDALAQTAAAQAHPVIQLLVVQETDTSRLALNLDVISGGSLPASPIVKLSFDGPVHALPAFDATDEAASQQALNHLVGVGMALLGDCPAAEARLNQSAQVFATMDAALAAEFYMGACRLRADDKPGASRHFERVIAAAPSLSRAPHAAINLAWINVQLGQPEAATKLMDALVAASAPDQPDYSIDRHIKALVARSQVRALMSQFDLALADMDAAIALRPNDSALYVERAQRMTLQSEWDQVLADYNRALEIDPTYAPAYFGRGLLYYSQGPLENALADFKAYIELAPFGEHAAEARSHIEAIEAELQEREG